MQKRRSANLMIRFLWKCDFRFHSNRMNESKIIFETSSSNFCDELFYSNFLAFLFANCGLLPLCCFVLVKQLVSKLEKKFLCNWIVLNFGCCFCLFIIIYYGQTECYGHQVVTTCYRYFTIEYQIRSIISIISEKDK